MYKTVAKALAITLLLNGSVVASLDEAAALIEAGSEEAALQLLAAQPGSARSRLLRANALAGLQRNGEAEALYRALISEFPQDPAPYNNLARLYAATGRLQEASELLTRAMKSDPRYATIYTNLSRVYVEMSSNAYARALQLNEPKQALQLVSLDSRPSSSELQLAAAKAPAPQPATPVTTGREVRVAEVPAPTVPTELKVTPAFDGGGAIAALKVWAAAWSAQDVEGYLAAYDTEYLPPNGLGLTQWQAQRRARLLKPDKIEVVLSDFEVSSSGGGSVTVKVLQRYRSDRYRDSTRKGFILLQRDGVWKIGDEYTIAVIN